LLWPTFPPRKKQAYRFHLVQLAQAGATLMSKQRFKLREKHIEGHALNLSEADIEAINLSSKVVVASRKLQKALGAITGWRLASQTGIPKNKFRLIVAYEDALGDLGEALMRATLKRMQGTRPRR
jgi:NACalpha-BTF3-like transcription factor